jgi:hypothetical protein
MGMTASIRHTMRDQGITLKVGKQKYTTMESSTLHVFTPRKNA